MMPAPCPIQSSPIASRRNPITVSVVFMARPSLSGPVCYGTGIRPTPEQQKFYREDITALVDKAKADRKGEAPVTAEPILVLAPYRAQLEYRPGHAPAAVHTED